MNDWLEALLFDLQTDQPPSQVEMVQLLAEKLGACQCEKCSTWGTDVFKGICDQCAADAKYEDACFSRGCRGCMSCIGVPAYGPI